MPRHDATPPSPTRPVALLRAVPLSLPRCALTHRAREPIDPDRARAQHRAYADALRAAGLDVVVLPADEALPDCVFVEDVLVDVGSARVLTAPGAESRRGEREAIRAAFAAGGLLERFGPLVPMPDGLRLDGGDVLAAGGALYVGLSTRTERDAVAWLADQTDRPVYAVPVRGALHLKSAVTALSERALLVDPAHLDVEAFHAFDVLRVPPGEEPAVNALRLPPRPELRTTERRDERVLLAMGYPRTAAILRRWGFVVIEVAVDELRKAEAGLTCMSVILGASWGAGWPA